jgi:hypothetical protein
LLIVIGPPSHERQQGIPHLLQALHHPWITALVGMVLLRQPPECLLDVLGAGLVRLRQPPKKTQKMTKL